MSIEDINLPSHNLPPEKRGRGRPSHKPTDENRKIVQAVIGFGMTEEQVAIIMGIDENTLRKYYSEEIKRGLPLMLAAVSKNLYRLAMGNGREAVGAAIFILKARAGWSEYSPAPGSLRDEKMGKKAEADMAAKTADQGTGWAGLLN